jgi:hypothetical protein
MLQIDNRLSNYLRNERDLIQHYFGENYFIDRKEIVGYLNNEQSKINLDLKTLFLNSKVFKEQLQTTDSNLKRELLELYLKESINKENSKINTLKIINEMDHNDFEIKEKLFIKVEDSEKKSKHLNYIISLLQNKISKEQIDKIYTIKNIKFKKEEYVTSYICLLDYKNIYKINQMINNMKLMNYELQNEKLMLENLTLNESKNIKNEFELKISKFFKDFNFSNYFKSNINLKVFIETFMNDIHTFTDYIIHKILSFDVKEKYYFGNDFILLNLFVHYLIDQNMMDEFIKMFTKNILFFKNYLDHESKTILQISIIKSNYTFAKYLIENGLF